MEGTMPDTERRWKGLIFTPDDEPYLGRELLFHFDEVITASMEQNSRIIPLTRQRSLSDLQKAATQLIPQRISLALSIRELIRRGSRWIPPQLPFRVHIGSTVTGAGSSPDDDQDSRPPSSRGCPSGWFRLRS